MTELTESLGADWNEWRWGRLNQFAFPHSLTPVFDLPTVERMAVIDAGGVAEDAGRITSAGPSREPVLCQCLVVGRPLTGPTRWSAPGS